MFGEPALAVTRWGTLKVDHRTLHDQPARRVRRRRHRARRSLVVWAIRDGRDAAAQIHRLSAAGEGRGARCAMRRGMSDATSERRRSKSRAVPRQLERQRRTPAPHLSTRRRSTMPAASAWSPRIDGKPRREVVQAGIDALKAVWHRGAVDADGKTGDGAGIHVEIPQDFFAAAVERGGAQAARRPHRASARSSCRKTDLGAQERCRTIVETEILSFGYLIYGWRQVPIDVAMHRREGQRHAARDRADHAVERARRRRRRTSSSATSISSAGASRSRRCAKRRSRISISARCRRARSSTRACSWPSS